MILNKVFEEMYNFPQSGIYVIINKKKKYVYISYSKNLLTTVCKNIREMQNRVHVYKPLNKGDIKDWKFSIIETINKDDNSILDISTKINYYITEYRNIGYDIKTYTNIVKFKFRVDVGQDYRVYCKLITRGYKEYVVGVFNNRQESKQFEELYRNMKVIIPIYSINSLTKEYIETLRVNSSQ